MPPSTYSVEQISLSLFTSVSSTVVEADSSSFEPATTSTLLEAAASSSIGQ